MSSPLNINEVSLDVQNELLAGQSTAVESLNMLTSIMSQALKPESRYQQVVCISSRDPGEICVCRVILYFLQNNMQQSAECCHR